MSLFRRPGRGREDVPDDMARAIEWGPGDRLLAWARDAATGAYVVASLHALHHVPAFVVGADGAGAGNGAGRDGGAAAAAAPSALGASGAARWSRPWLDVAAGAWEPKTRTITVTWADGGRPSMWTIADERVDVPSVLQDRVRASVVLSVPVQLGDRDLGRVALRKDLASGALVEQVSLRHGSAVKDPEVAAYVEVLLRDLREQAGL